MSRRASIALIASLLLGSIPALAGDGPEYARLGLATGMGVEVKGSLDSGGMIAARDLEVLPEPRRPKLRGRLEEVVDGAAIRMFGLIISVDDDTEIVGDPVSELRPGRMIEVKCRVGVDGTWRASRVTSRNVKESEKIKGTITAMSYDGVAPDTLSIEGLLILLDEDTDADVAGTGPGEVERDLYGDLAFPDGRDLDRVHVHGGGRSALAVEYRHNLRASSDFDLTGRYDSDREDTQPELRAEWSGFWSDDFRTHVVARARRTYVLDSDLDLPDRDAEIQVTQAYALWRGVGADGVSLQAGRQEYDDPREWIYDEYLDGVRIFLHDEERWSFQASYIHAVEPLKEKLATWTDILAMAEYRPAEDLLAAAWFLKRRDSDEARNREPVWWGLRLLGEPTPSFDGWLDLAMMRGEDKHEPLDAWAVDVGGTLHLAESSFSPSLTAGYAFATGDETGADDVENSFRQTGYQDNSDRLGGTTSVFYYGAALDPELSNISILTLGGSLRPSRGSSVGLYWHRYRQHHPDDKVRGDLVDPPARPNGQSPDLGWGLDLVVGLPRFMDRMKASWTLGLFEPGEAFSPRRERALLNKINVTVEI